MSVDTFLEKCFCERPQGKTTCQLKGRYAVKRHFCVSERKIIEQFKGKEGASVNVFEASIYRKITHSFQTVWICMKAEHTGLSCVLGGPVSLYHFM